MYYQIADEYLLSDKVDTYQIDLRYNSRNRIQEYQTNIRKKTSAFTVLRSR